MEKEEIIWNITHSGERDRKSNGRYVCGGRLKDESEEMKEKMENKNDAEGRGIVVVVVRFSSYICKKISLLFSSPSLFLHLFL